MDNVDCIVVGAGVIGLAVSRQLALAGREVWVVESHPDIGMETSSRNSEVIHAGLYYETGSLKAELCLTGRDMLYAYCEERNIPHRRCGKLIVATSNAQREKLASILSQAHTNGCDEVTALTAKEARSIEPALSCVAALSSPNTGIIDSHAYMLALQGDAIHAGAAFAFNSRLKSGRTTANGVELLVRSHEGEEIELLTGTVINCAGLSAPHIATQIDGLDQTSIPTPYFAKGNYFSLSGKSPFSQLIYPVPDADGLGVHLTLDLGGCARFGPDVEWLEAGSINYEVNLTRAEKFYRAIRTYWPALPDGALQPAYAGIRPKIDGSHSMSSDFLFATHDCPHYLGLYGVESPGLTASLAIAAHVANLI